MTAVVQKRGLAELLAFSNADFEKEIKEMSLKDLLDTISTLQREMTKEQENFNSLRAELASLNKSSSQYKQISKEMTASQSRLTALMDRSMKCFQQQGSQTTSTKFPNVQRRNSLKETNNTEQPSSKPVQRNQSARIPNKDGELTPVVLINKANAKSTPDLITSSNKPVFLKSLTNVNTKIEVKKPSTTVNPSILKPVYTIYNGTSHSEANTNGEQKLNLNSNEMKKQTVKTSATFNLQKSRSTEFLANNKSSINGNAESNGQQTKNFNVILRKTNRNLIDNEEQESNFRHSVDLDSKGSQKPSVVNSTKSTETSSTSMNGTSTTQKPSVANPTKSAETLSDINKTSSVNVTSTTQKSKPISGTLQKPSSNDNEKVLQNVKLKYIEDKATIQNDQEKITVAKGQEEPQKKQVVSSSIQFRPTTAVEAKAVSTGERQNLLSEIQNFKRKPNLQTETVEKSSEVKVEDRKSETPSVPEIVKSGIKKGRPF